MNMFNQVMYILSFWCCRFPMAVVVAAGEPTPRAYDLHPTPQFLKSLVEFTSEVKFKAIDFSFTHFTTF